MQSKFDVNVLLNQWFRLF